MSSTQHAVFARRTRRLALGGTFLVAFSLAVQLAQSPDRAFPNLLMTAPVIFLGAVLNGWVVRASAAFAIALAAGAILCTLGVYQSGSAYTDELLLFSIPFSGLAAIVVGHCRDWPGKTAGAMALVLVALSIGVGMTEFPIPFIVLHLAILIALPTVPFPTSAALQRKARAVASPSSASSY